MWSDSLTGRIPRAPEMSGWSTCTNKPESFMDTGRTLEVLQSGGCQRVPETANTVSQCSHESDKHRMLHCQSLEGTSNHVDYLVGMTGSGYPDPISRRPCPAPTPSTPAAYQLSSFQAGDRNVVPKIGSLLECW